MFASLEWKQASGGGMVWHPFLFSPSSCAEAFRSAGAAVDGPSISVSTCLACSIRSQSSSSREQGGRGGRHGYLSGCTACRPNLFSFSIST